jgi:hypothetical protein
MSISFIKLAAYNRPHSSVRALLGRGLLDASDGCVCVVELGLRVELLVVMVGV